VSLVAGSNWVVNPLQGASDRLDVLIPAPPEGTEVWETNRWDEPFDAIFMFGVWFDSQRRAPSLEAAPSGIRSTRLEEGDKARGRLVFRRCFPRRNRCSCALMVAMGLRLMVACGP
jgi:hypothetical protein